MAVFIEVSAIAFVKLVPEDTCVKIAVLPLVGRCLDSVVDVAFIRHIPVAMDKRGMHF